SIREGRIIPQSKMTVSEATRERLATFTLQEGDVVLARRGEMGRCAIVTSREAGWLCGTGSLIIRPDTETDPAFLAMALGAPRSRAYLLGGSVGATMRNLNQRVVRGLPLRLPCLKEQKRLLALVEHLADKCSHLRDRMRQRDAL